MYKYKDFVLPKENLLRQELRTLVVVILLALLMTAISNATNETADGGDEMLLEEMDWLAGRWVGEGFGGICEETWNPSSGGSMTGAFKLVVNDAVVFYEIMTITLVDGKPQMRLKHFNADLTGWEEKMDVVEFAYTSSGAESIEFDGLKYELTDDKSLRIVVGHKSAEGESSETVIKCKKQPL
ncbi:MAG: DUF6265 family protein [bacterium]|nr:DUF6265 family protein [bacterium]